MNRHRIVALTLALAASASALLSACHNNDTEMGMDTGAAMETAVRTDLENIYTAKGKIISGQESSMNVKGSSSQDAIVVDEVYVQVGDLVKAGDVLYTIDNTQTERDLALKEQQQAISDQQNAIAQSNNQRALSDAQADSGDQYETGTRSLLRDAEDTNKALTQQISDQQKLQSYRDEETKAKAALDTLQAQVDSLQADYDDKYAHYQDLNRQVTMKTAQDTGSDNASAAGSGSTQNPGTAATTSPEDQRLVEDCLRAQWSSEDAKTALDRAQTQLTDAKAKYETAKSNRESYENTVKSDADQTTTQVRGLEDQGTTVNKNNRSVLSAEQAARNAIASQSLSHESDTLTNESEIAKLKEKLENGQVIATMDGTVTAVNVTPGQSYSGSDGVVLDNLSKMKVSADIDEAHIADLSVGTRVRVKTDSTGNDELEGTVTFTSPTPTKETANTNGSGSTSSGSSGNSQNTKTRATYKVEVTLDEPNDRLRIGMTATIDFIVASAQNVIAVPTSCLIDDGNGNYFVNVVSSENSEDGMTAEEGDTSGETGASGGSALPASSEVMVTTGVSDDYYTEITSGNITEGEELLGASMDGSGDYSDMMSGIYDTQ